MSDTHVLSLSTCAFVLFAVGCGGSSKNEAAPDSGTGSSDSGTVEAGGSLDGSGGGEASSGQDASSADSSTPTGLESVRLYSCLPLVYTAPVTLGTQPFQLLFDTGSTTLAVAGSSCSCMTATPKYTPGPTAVDQKQTAMANYGSGSWSGEIYQDDVALDTAPTTPVKLAAISTETNFFNAIQCDSSSGGNQGIIGFGPTDAASAGTTGFFDDYVATHHVPDVFSIKLCDTGGTLWLGGFDATAMTAMPQYVPLDTLPLGTGMMLDQLYYAVGLTSITANGTDVVVGANAQVPDVVVDTGTSAVLLNTNSYNGLTAAIQGNAAFTQIFGSSFFPTAANSLGTPACKMVTETKAQLDAMLPVLTFKFGGVSVQAVATESYLFTYAGQWCSSLAGDSAALGPLAGILGAPAIRSNVVVYDRAQKRVGFAPHTPCP